MSALESGSSIEGSHQNREWNDSESYPKERDTKGDIVHFDCLSLIRIN